MTAGAGGIKGYIAVEGVIGVGKTSLATLLSERLGARLNLEEVEENPFLDDFYGDMRGYAFQTQIFFLLSRFRQQQDLMQRDLFSARVVSDYIFAKDKIFAHLNLSDKELSLYDRLVRLLEREIPKPDVVIYLKASTDFLLDRIRSRARPYEKHMPRDYIDVLNQAYNYFFAHYDDTPLLVVNRMETDFLHRPAEVERLIAEVDALRGGTAQFTSGGGPPAGAPPGGAAP
jgi:deoxyadenosine/deoxycytidine kinase